MKTPMQELLEWVRATLPMDLETPRLIEQKIESMLEKEKQQIMDAHSDGALHTDWDENTDVIENAQDYYNETFNTKERWKHQYKN